MEWETVRRRAQAWLWRTRYLVAAVCCGLAVTTAVAALRPAPPATEAVAVSAHALEAGATLTAGDIQVVRVPPNLVPDGASAAAKDLTGKHIAVGIPQGVALVPGVVTTDLTSSAPQGTVVTPVHLDSAVTALLEPGMRVDLLTVTTASGLDDGGASAQGTHIARSAVVIAGVKQGGGSGGSLFGGGDSGGTPATLVAVKPEEAALLAAASGRITAVLVP